LIYNFFSCPGPTCSSQTGQSPHSKLLVSTTRRFGSPFTHETFYIIFAEPNKSCIYILKFLLSRGKNNVCSAKYPALVDLLCLLCIGSCVRVCVVCVCVSVCDVGTWDLCQRSCQARFFKRGPKKNNCLCFTTHTHITTHKPTSPHKNVLVLNGNVALFGLLDLPSRSLLPSTHATHDQKDTELKRTNPCQQVLLVVHCLAACRFEVYNFLISSLWLYKYLDVDIDIYLCVCTLHNNTTQYVCMLYVCIMYVCVCVCMCVWKPLEF